MWCNHSFEEASNVGEDMEEKKQRKNRGVSMISVCDYGEPLCCSLTARPSKENRIDERKEDRASIKSKYSARREQTELLKNVTHFPNNFFLHSHYSR